MNYPGEPMPLGGITKMKGALFEEPENHLG